MHDTWGLCGHFLFDTRYTIHDTWYMMVGRGLFSRYTIHDTWYMIHECRWYGGGRPKKCWYVIHDTWYMMHDTCTYWLIMYLHFGGLIQETQGGSTLYPVPRSRIEGWRHRYISRRRIQYNDLRMYPQDVSSITYHVSCIRCHVSCIRCTYMI